jgi:RNA polymerase sigma factor (sigma-70 family)
MIRLAEDRHPLVLNNLALAQKFAKPYIQAYPYGDWRSVAYLGLVRAAARFDPGRGVPFSYFAWRGIVGALQDAWRSEQRYRNARLDPRAYRLASQPAHDPGPEDVAARLLRPLPPPIRSTVKLVVIDGHTHAEAARQLGCSPTLVHKRLKRGLKQIRTLVEANA